MGFPHYSPPQKIRKQSVAPGTTALRCRPQLGASVRIGHSIASPLQQSPVNLLHCKEFFFQGQPLALHRVVFAAVPPPALHTTLSLNGVGALPLQPGQSRPL